jgi:enamine deaminase RidA (YjgF/YER057c/UK114 family)
LRRCLAEQGATFHHFVSQTVYTTDIDELAKHADVFATAFAGEAPTATWLQVERLFHPAQLLEISGIAVLG